MSDSECDDRSEGRREKSDPLDTQLAFVEEVFRELFHLLEEYAPMWFTEEHHGRAVAAASALEQSRQLAKAEAARAQKAG